jgi:hypothetical protein
LAHALRDGERPLIWGLPAAVYCCCMPRVAAAPGREHDTADHDGREERAPERRLEQKATTAEDCQIH